MSEQDPEVIISEDGVGRKSLKIEGHPAGTAEWGDWTGIHGWAFRPPKDYEFLFMPNVLNAISNALNRLNKKEPDPFGLGIIMQPDKYGYKLWSVIIDNDKPTVELLTEDWMQEMDAELIVHFFSKDLYRFHVWEKSEIQAINIAKQRQSEIRNEVKIHFLRGHTVFHKNYGNWEDQKWEEGKNRSQLT